MTTTLTERLRTEDEAEKSAAVTAYRDLLASHDSSAISDSKRLRAVLSTLDLSREDFDADVAALAELHAETARLGDVPARVEAASAQLDSTRNALVEEAKITLEVIAKAVKLTEWKWFLRGMASMIAVNRSVPPDAIGVLEKLAARFETQIPAAEQAVKNAEDIPAYVSNAVGKLRRNHPRAAEAFDAQSSRAEGTTGQTMFHGS